ncbi:hypothetical protein CYMTET_51026 [Cymbomonas tetramitiformis]|uniref:Uncharacterized protein n=1 Tax=Cymbomonas tetramitiformis TaxID=36881 RepID=A0AAE0ESK2_9CHLO|nr:hypothetical protein CYMTET_51026 [Cymbomonas tetramitiformis]
MTNSAEFSAFWAQSIDREFRIKKQWHDKRELNGQPTDGFLKPEPAESKSALNEGNILAEEKRIHPQDLALPKIPLTCQHCLAMRHCSTPGTTPSPHRCAPSATSPLSSARLTYITEEGTGV